MRRFSSVLLEGIEQLRAAPRHGERSTPAAIGIHTANAAAALAMGLTPLDEIGVILRRDGISPFRRLGGRERVVRGRDIALVRYPRQGVQTDGLRAKFRGARIWDAIQHVAAYVALPPRQSCFPFPAPLEIGGWNKIVPPVPQKKTSLG